jgi:hypothetical protein
MRNEAGSALQEASSSGRLGLALTVSVAAHAALVLGVSVNTVALPGSHLLRGYLVPVPMEGPTRVSPPTESLEQTGLKTAAAQPEAVPETTVDAAPSAITGGSDIGEPSAASQPPIYYLPQDVDVRASVIGLQTTPVSEKEMLLGRLVRVKLRLYISERGTVDRFDVLESDGMGSSVTIDDVRDFRFNPAQKNGQPVATQKVVELTFGR